jgi:hypothetical protein
VIGLPVVVAFGITMLPVPIGMYIDTLVIKVEGTSVMVVHVEVMEGMVESSDIDVDMAVMLSPVDMAVVISAGMVVEV